MTEQERLTLTVLGLAVLAGLTVLVWQRQRPPLTVVGSPGPAAAVAWDGALRSARQVDVNTAGVAELERLPDIGPALAGRIVEERETRGPFRSAEELSRVKGIGPKTYEPIQLQGSEVLR